MGGVRGGRRGVAAPSGTWAYLVDFAFPELSSIQQGCGVAGHLSWLQRRAGRSMCHGPVMRRPRATLTLSPWGVQAQGEAPAAATAVSVARGRMHLVAATAWRRHGCASLAAAEAAAFLSCHTLDPDDTLHAYATLALIANDLQGVPPRTPAAACMLKPTGLRLCRQSHVQHFISAGDFTGCPPSSIPPGGKARSLRCFNKTP